jgi:hypothetical protein
MALTNREFWTAVHGLIFGSLFLLAFTGGLAGLYSLRPEWVTAAGLKERLTRLKWGMIAMAVAAFGTVITGTYVVYPWYRAPAPEGADLTQFPRNFLLANPDLSGWHIFGMEWKEHVAWISPILAVAAAFLVVKYGSVLAENAKLRRMVAILFVLSFATAAIAGLLGAFITKAAPIL